MKILVTGIAGFIGSYVANKLLEQGNEVVGLDNMNEYYDIQLKIGRLKRLGINQSVLPYNTYLSSTLHPLLSFIKLNLEDRENVAEVFKHQKFDRVCHLAAQAGVRYSLENPYAYTDSNITGFINILEDCRKNSIEHLIYASSSSVYGLNGKVPFSEEDSIAHPVSLYAATKKANELMAHAYSCLYNLPTTGLRFFTVYGPWGRPDMAPFLFMEAIMNERPIKVFNNGNMLRDFTYIDDIVEGILQLLPVIPQANPDWNPLCPDPSSSIAPYRIYNIGNSSPVKLMDFIRVLEETIGKKAIKNFLPMQPGDVHITSANTDKLEQVTHFRPQTDIYTGIRNTVEWYKDFYNIK